MTPDRWIVLIGGLLLVAFIVWFFWLKRAKGVRAAETSSRPSGGNDSGQGRLYARHHHRPPPRRAPPHYSDIQVSSSMCSSSDF